MADVIGSAVLQVTADASGVSAGMAQAGQAVKQFEQTAKTAGKSAGAAIANGNKQASVTSSELTREQKRLIDSIERYSQSVGKTRGEVLAQRAAQSGLTDQVQAQIASIKQAEQALKSGGTQFDKYGLSAKQTAAALRQVPAQITDIAVSLQGGQKPLTVLLQQGGQLKDVFGGVVPAARALGGALVNLINPYTILLGTVGALAVAYNQGSKENDAYNRALILTGNAAGTTAGQLSVMARNIDGVIGTQGAAADALAKLAGTGEVAAKDLERFAITTIRLQRDAGIAVADTVKEFAELGKDPVTASEKLNEKYRYLTLSVYDQIKALAEQGRELDAAALAQNAYADAMDGRTAKLNEQLGSIERGWRAVISAAKEAWDAILGVGRASSSETQLANLNAQIAALEAQQKSREDRGLATGDIAPRLKAAIARRDVLQQTTATLAAQAKSEGDIARANEEAIEARKRIQKLTDETLTSQQKINKALGEYRRDVEKIRAAGGVVDPAEVARVEANIRSKFAGRKPPEFRDDAATKLLQQLRETEASLTAQLNSEEQLGTAARARAEFEQKIADLKEKKTLTADQKSILAARDLIAAQLDQNVAVERQIKAQKDLFNIAKEVAAEKKREAEEEKRIADRFEENSRRRAETIESSRQGRLDQYGRTLGAFGLSDSAREQIENQKAIYREAQRLQLDLIKNTPKNLLGSDKYMAEMVAIKNALDQALQDNQGYYKALEVLQANGALGAARALATYQDSAKDVSAQIESVFTGAFKNIEDAIVNFTKTGKLDIKNFADFVISEFLRIQVRQALSSVSGSSGFGSFLSLIGLGGGSGLASVANSLPGDSLDNFLKLNDNFRRRAMGGPVDAGGVYQVNENAPELLNWQGKQFLMMGNSGGNVQPAGGGGGGNTFVFHGQQNRNELMAAAQQIVSTSVGIVAESNRRRGPI